MVNRGPSTACERCRSRNTKCDRKKPNCSQCERQGFQCPGYRDVGGIVFKDQSQAVVERQVRRAQAIATASASSSSTSTSTTPAATIPGALSDDVRTTCIQFFFRRYVASSPRELLLSRGHFDNLELLYGRSSPDSALGLATYVMAARAMYLSLDNTADPMRWIADEGKALQAIQRAVYDPVDSLRDETLLAVLCLDHVEHLISSKTGRPPSTAHTYGALMLIHHRKSHGFNNTISQSLVAATRSNLVLQNFWITDIRSQEAIEKFPEVSTASCSPLASLHHVLLAIQQIYRSMPHHRKNLDEASKRDLATSQIEPAQKLDDDLRVISNSLPVEWKMLLGELYLPGPQPSMSQGVERPSLPEAHVCGQFHCVRLMVLKALYVSTMNSNLPATTKAQNTLAILQAVQLVVDRLFLVLSYMRTLAGHEIPKDIMKGQQIESVLRVDTFGVGEEASTVLEGRLNLLSLTRWSTSTLTVQIPGSEGFGVSPSSMELLRAEFRDTARVMDEITLKTDVPDPE